MHIALRTAIFVFLMAPFVTSAAADDLRGWFTEGCGYSSFHFAGVAELGAATDLVVHVGLGYPGPGLGPIVDVASETWLDVSAERCASSSQCERIQRAKIWFQPAHGNFKHLTGKLSFDLGAQQIERDFVARRRKAKPVPRCE